MANNGGGKEIPRVLRLAIELDNRCDDVERFLAGRKSGHNNQLQRASSSLLANTKEALDAEGMGEKRKFFGYAKRSTGECEGLFEGSLGKAIPPELRDDCLRLARDHKLDCLRLIAWTHRNE